MGADVFVSFGADTGGLEAGFARAKAESKLLANEIANLAAEMVKAGASADSDLGQHLNQLGAQLADVKSHMGELSAEMRKHTQEASLVGEALGRMREGFAAIAEIAGIAFTAEA